jgi:hypothetical protein
MIGQRARNCSDGSIHELGCDDEFKDRHLPRLTRDVSSDQAESMHEMPVEEDEEEIEEEQMAMVPYSP